jgi:hypothetical protein
MARENYLPRQRRPRKIVVKKMHNHLLVILEMMITTLLNIFI